MSSSQRDSSNKTPTVLNLILLGTNYHHLAGKNRHLFTELAGAIERGPNQSVHLIDGVGGEPDANHKDAALHPMLGDYNFSTTYSRNTGNITVNKTRRETFMGTSSLSGKLTGKGYRDAIKEAITIVDLLCSADKTPLILNMYGFSRGADTALRIANTLHGLYDPSLVKVNIFAVDPVAGMGRRQAKKAQLIPDNVEEYHSILMQDENRPGFEPQDKRRLKVQNPAITTVSHKLYAGIHGDGLRLQAEMKPAADAKPDLTATVDTTRLVWDDLHKFAWRHATLLKHMPYLLREGPRGEHTWKQFDYTPLSDIDRLQTYSRMVSNRQHFAKRRPVSEELHTREIVKYKYDYLLHGQTYFQDQEHLRLFYQQYPHVFDFYFQQHRGGADPAKVLADIQQLQKQPDILASLQQVALLNIADIHDINQLGEPRGIPLTITDLQTDLGKLWEKVLAIANPVLTGLDDSVSDNVAKKLLDDTRTLLLADLNLDTKMQQITERLTKTIIAERTNKPFIERLAALLPSDEKATPPEPYSKRLARTLQEQVSGIKIFGKKALEKGQTRIVNQVCSTLKEIETLGLGNDNTVLSRVLTLALYQSRELAREHLDNRIKESPFDKLLRKELIQISSFPSSPSSRLAEEKVQTILNTLTEKLSEPVSAPPLSPTSPKK